MLLALQEKKKKAHNLTRQTLAEKLDQMAFVNSKESIFLLSSIPQKKVLGTLHILIAVRFMEKMKSYKQLDTLSKLNAISSFSSHPPALFPEKLGVILSHMFKVTEKHGWIEFISYKETLSHSLTAFCSFDMFK